MTDELIDLTSQQLCDKLLQSNDSDEINQIISIFNSNLKKREIIRTSTLSDLQDSITNQMSLRVQNNADCFSNKDLLDYMRTVQGLLDSQKSDNVDQKIPQIAIQNNVVVNSDELTKDSRDKITQYIQEILASDLSQDNVIEEKEVKEKQGE